MARVLTVLVSLALTLMVLTDCGGAAGGREISVQAGSSSGRMFYAPNAVTIKAGESVVFVIKNVDTVDHEFESDDLGFGEVIIPAGATRKVPLTAPSRSGAYEVVCDLPGHKEAGMLMNVTVQ